MPKYKTGMKNFVVNFKNECVRLSCITFVAERFGLFAVRLPSLSRGKMDLGSGITFDIFTHVFHGLCFKFLLKGVKKIHERKKEKIHYEVLDEGYNVVKAETKQNELI